MENNLPFSLADHLSPIIHDVFSDSQIAKRYASARTKTMCMLNLALAPHFQGNYYCLYSYLLKVVCMWFTLHSQYIISVSFLCIVTLVEEMKTYPFGLLMDVSNDTGVEKLNPLTIRVLDLRIMEVTTQLLDMCTTSGCHCGTADSIFNKIGSVLSIHNIPWGNCVGFGGDNTSVNVGMHYSYITHVKQNNNSCYFMG